MVEIASVTRRRRVDFRLSLAPAEASIFTLGLAHSFLCPWPFAIGREEDREDPGRPHRRCLVTARAAHAARRGRVPLGSFTSRALQWRCGGPKNSAGIDFHWAALPSGAQGPQARDRMIVCTPNAAHMGSTPEHSPRDDTSQVPSPRGFLRTGVCADRRSEGYAGARHAVPGLMGQPFPANLLSRPPARKPQNSPGANASGEPTGLRTRHLAAHRSSRLNDQTYVDRCHTRGRNPRGGAGR